MRVLITGGAGFIGAHCGQALQERGDEVVVLDNFNAYYDPRLKRARVERLLAPGTNVREVDITQAEPVERTVRDVRPDAVLHFAAWAGVRPSRNFPGIFTAANVAGTVNVFEACRRAGVGTIVFASSSSVYPPTAPAPFLETQSGDEPASGYGASKRTGELYAAVYHRLDGLAITSLRFFTVYGPWGRPDMALWKFTERMLRGEPLPVNVRSRDGRAVARDFTEVSDIVQGVLAALDREHPWAVVNLGAADAVPLRRLVAVLEAATGKQARIEEHVLPAEEAVHTAADLSRARDLLGFAPRVRIEEGVRRFVAWYQTEYRSAFPDGLASSQYW